jgi:hypothetical protein
MLGVFLKQALGLHYTGVEASYVWELRRSQDGRSSPADPATSPEPRAQRGGSSCTNIHRMALTMLTTSDPNTAGQNPLT